MALPQSGLNDMEKIIEFKNVSFKYSEEETDVINNLSLDFYEGQFTCVLGHNGSGKSTLAKLMNAINYPTEGTVKSFGYDTSNEENEIKISRKNLAKRIDEKSLNLKDISEIENVSDIVINQDIQKEIVEIFEQVLNKKLKKNEYALNFFYELGGDSLLYFSIPSL